MHVARGMRRLAIVDTMIDEQEGYIGEHIPHMTFIELREANMQFFWHSCITKESNNAYLVSSNLPISYSVSTSCNSYKCRPFMLHFSVPDHLDFDTFWKVTRGRSVILEGYKDEIATSKHKAARTIVQKYKWLPYGERYSENSRQTAYAMLLLRRLSDGLDAKGSKDPNIIRVMQTSFERYAYAKLHTDHIFLSFLCFLLQDVGH